MKIQESADYVAEFLKRHGLHAGSSIDAEVKAIHWAGAATALVNEGFTRLADDVLEHDAAAGLLLNLLHRAFEHLDASTVAYVTASPASSEALSRVTMELAVSISYIVAEHREARLFSFLRNYIDSEGKRLRNWERTARGLQEEKKQHQLDAIAYRRSGIESLAEVLDVLRLEMTGKGADIHDHSWPSVADRFEALGITGTYRTVYGRMSSQIHSDAEETIRYFLAVSSPDQSLRERMVAESWAFSRFMLYFAVKYYLAACEAFAHTYGMTRQFHRLRFGATVIEKELHVLAKQVD